jgi:CubicO group peptidase (beta-lactamase class C family)
MPPLVCRYNIHLLIVLTEFPSWMSCSLNAQNAGQVFVQRLVAELRAACNAPALGALVLSAEGSVVLAVDGTRQWGRENPVTEDDRWHIGSNGKAITATLIARLIERGLLSFDTTTAEVFPDLVDNMRPGFRAVTVSQLLTHTAGTDANPSLFARLRYWNSSESPSRQRLHLLKIALHRKPRHTPGSAFSYSNIGYVIAGAIAERVCGQPWEHLIFREVFAPLGIRDFGFGAPGSHNRVDQPRGHRAFFFGHVAAPTSSAGDNPLALGPAGTLHISLRDWARFAREHLNGAQGKGALLRYETYAELHRARYNSYAMGWIVERTPKKGEVALTHAGSNTFWYARIYLVPSKHYGFLIVANDATDRTRAAVHKLEDKLKHFFAL